MKRRSFGLLAGASLTTLKICPSYAQSTVDVSKLTSSLTPVGAERAGNSEGSIPEWTGGYTSVPDGWQPGDYMPDFFADEPVVLVIDSSNMAQHSNRLSDGVMAMMQKYGFSIKVYPTHRTASAPQWVYDNIAVNAANAKLDPAGGRLGYIDAYGGVPFPIPDASDPEAAGAQIIWNHNARWSGYAYALNSQSYVVSNGNIALADISPEKYDFPYYSKAGNLSNFDGIQWRGFTTYLAPANLVGSEVIEWQKTDPYSSPNEFWQLLNGQGRVRRAPELAFDTPSSFADGVVNFDEYFGFNGSLEKYDWTLVEKKEVYIPYNNNGMYLLPAEQVHLKHFLDPNAVRWELHRVWVVDAKLHPGERNVLARRRLYVDEDSWTIGLVDAWDANGELYKVNTVYNYLRPDLPGLVYGNSSVLNLQTDNYASLAGVWNEKQAGSTFKFYDSFPDSLYDPQHMAATAQY